MGPNAFVDVSWRRSIALNNEVGCFMVNCGRDDIVDTKDDVDGTITQKRRRKVLLQVDIVIKVKGSISSKL